MKTVRIVYTSISGNTEIVCQEVDKVLEAKKFTVWLDKCQLVGAEDLKNCDVLIFGCPTYAHGELQVYFDQFLETVKDMDLAGKPVAVIGLGDPKYDDDYNIESAQILSDWFEAHGGSQIIEPLKINRCPVPQLEEKVKIWAEKLAKKIS